MAENHQENLIAGLMFVQYVKDKMQEEGLTIPHSQCLNVDLPLGIQETYKNLKQFLDSSTSTAYDIMTVAMEDDPMDQKLIMQQTIQTLLNTSDKTLLIARICVVFHYYYCNVMRIMNIGTGELDNFLCLCSEVFSVEVDKKVSSIGGWETFRPYQSTTTRMQDAYRRCCTWTKNKLHLNKDV
ncbi:uncharacterized protein LOC131957421 [Physella acuta]|uniref:uncharacterized protein LOC131957421 n=1 Tax=Physella acuta TaxID=109671 RepID=UPI0027DC54DD|nr:uncharacterized protein LOC131957421 [Physella acuta]